MDVPYPLGVTPRSTPSQLAKHVVQNGIWSSFPTWLLALLMVYLLTAGQFMTKDIAGDASLAQGSTENPFDVQMQIAAWVIGVGIMLPYLKQTLKAAFSEPLIASLMGMVLLSCIWADVGVVECLRRGVMVDLTILLAFYISSRYTQQEQLSLLYSVGIIAVVSCYVVAMIAPDYNHGFDGEWKGIFGHKNDLAIYLPFAVTPALFLKPRKPSRFFIKFAIIALSLVLLVLSQSRSGWITCTAFLAYLAISKLIPKGKSRKIILSKMVLITGVVLVGVLIYENLGAVAVFLGKDPNLSNRTDIWAAILPSIFNRPWLGYGYGGFWQGLEGNSADVIFIIGTWLGHAHDGYLQIVLQLGLVGLALTLAITFSGFKSALKLHSSTEAKYYLWYTGALVMLMVGSIDESFLLHQNSLMTTIWALAIIELRKSARGERMTDDLSRP